LIFGWGVLLSAGMALGLPYLMLALYSTYEAAYNAYVITALVMACLLFPLSLAVNLSSLAKSPAVITTMFIVYSICIGGAFSAITLTVDSADLMYAFFISAGAFILMGALGVLTHGRIGRPLLFLIAIAVGMFVISMFNIFMFGNNTAYWITSVLCFVIYLLLAAVDTNRVIESANAHAFDDDKVAMVYAAYILYCDFVIIFWYILQFLIAIKGNSKN
jgi:FtsH-binding integral membrane protein